MRAMTTSPTTYACRLHPTVRAELHIPGTAHCIRCGKLLRRVQGPADPQPQLFDLEEKHRAL